MYNDCAAEFGTYVVEVTRRSGASGAEGGRPVRVRVPGQLLRPWREREAELLAAAASSPPAATTGTATTGTAAVHEARCVATAPAAAPAGEGEREGGGGGSSGVLLVAGTVVQVARRTWSNMNKLGGTGEGLLSVCPSVCLSVCLFMYPFCHLSDSLSSSSSSSSSSLLLLSPSSHAGVITQAFVLRDDEEDVDSGE
jgi:hypothetical protein